MDQGKPIVVDAATTVAARRPGRFETIYTRLGFQRAYNFPLFIVFAGAMVGFSLSRLYFYDFDGIFAKESAPGAMSDYHEGKYRVGMLLHLAACLPSGLLLVLQFVPGIRHRWLLLHRINGYVVLFLVIISNAGACIVLGRRESGTRVATQSAEATMVIMTTVSMSAAYWNIKRLQIDQHRAWMLRTFFYYGVIITNRIIDSIAAVVISAYGGYYTVWSCRMMEYTYAEAGLRTLQQDYPGCFSSSSPSGGPAKFDGRAHVVVEAIHDVNQPPNLGASLTIPFGTSVSRSTPHFQNTSTPTHLIPSSPPTPPPTPPLTSSSPAHTAPPSSAQHHLMGEFLLTWTNT
ncbi:microtubule associated protein [Diplodia corticola]|uniref:Microtubule associated protein n=1 Tax=Diplodia corticola TaxID=236234 RepID=A0A1J9QSP7_9PEZI|nr:microtubule associated protein [Diplodia corticola]OJD31010.1 microtubule associated protein [Diplodia corticola]